MRRRNPKLTRTWLLMISRGVSLLECLSMICIWLILPKYTLISDLNDRNDVQTKALNSKFESALAQVKELPEKKKLVDAVISELVLRAQRFDKNEQKHVHEMQKIEVNMSAKKHLAVLNLDCT
jgi:hypothetical protein